MIHDPPAALVLGARVLSFEVGHFGGSAVTVGGMLVLVLGIIGSFLVAALSARGVRRVLERRGVAPGTSYAISRLVRYAVAAIACMVALNSAGVNLGAVLAASTIGLVGIGLGVQRIAQDFLAGFILLVERPVAKGDFVRVGESVGTVENVGARTTRILTRDRVALIVPNSDLTTSVVLNYSQPSDEFRFAVRFGVAYGTSPALVKKVALEVAASCDGILDDPAPEVFFDDFGDSALMFTLTGWVAHAKQDRRTASAFRFALEPALAAAGIEIPFPQLDVHVRSAPQGQAKREA